MIEMNDLRKPDLCPECGGSRIKRIVGGIPNDVGWQMIEQGVAIPGDCFMRDWKEDWHCQDCGHEWCDRADPARIELEELYRRIKQRLEDKRS